WIGVPDLPRYGLVGRDELVTDLVNRLSTGTAVSLSAEGKGGVGKTALAVALAHRRDLLAHFRDGVLWASLGPKSEPFTALARWATAVGLDPVVYAGPYELKQAIRDAIGRRVLLLVIDDIWQQEHAELLLCGGPFCAHVLTTRDLVIAHAFAQGSEVITVPELEADPAFELLQTIAPKACAADPELAHVLALAVGGLPLAIELLGGYLPSRQAPFVAPSRGLL
ncbi:MAG: NB-ARC domain-containing protein, partial [Thermoanaerobaculia bacterium]